MYCVICICHHSTAFLISSLELDHLGVPTVTIPVDGVTNYYALFRVNLENETEIAVDTDVPKTGESELILHDPENAGQRTGFYHAQEMPIATPGDLDDDGIDDLFELLHPLLLNPLDASDASEDADEDGESNLAEYLALTDPAEVITNDIEFITSDSITIKGTYRRPAARPGTTFPAVLLIHQGKSSRSEWDPYVSAFITAGYTTLAFDIRGHGASSGETFPDSYYNDPTKTPKDVIGALEYVRSLPNTISNRVAIVGASIGGNLACVASQKKWIKTGVNISGKTSAVLNLAAESTLDLESMYHISSANDNKGNRAIWAQELYAATTVPRQVEIIPNTGVHGVANLAVDPTLIDRIIIWLNQTL